MPASTPRATAPSRRLRRVTREMVQARTRALAVIAGRDSLEVTQSDYEQARRELTGEREMNRQEAVLDAPAPAGNSPGPTASAAVSSWENEGGQSVPPLSTGSVPAELLRLAQ